MLDCAKEQPNRERYLRTLATMTPDERLAKAFQLSAWSRQLFLAGLRDRLPDPDPDCRHELPLFGRRVSVGLPCRPREKKEAT